MIYAGLFGDPGIQVYLAYGTVILAMIEVAMIPGHFRITSRSRKGICRISLKCTQPFLVGSNHLLLASPQMPGTSTRRSYRGGRALVKPRNLALKGLWVGARGWRGKEPFSAWEGSLFPPKDSGGVFPSWG